MLKSYKTKRLHYKGTQFFLDNKPYDLQGISFFNALFNKNFNESREVRKKWLEKFSSYGINMLRVWCQWDLKPSAKPFIDIDPDHTMYTSAGEVREKYFQRLTEMLEDADSLDMTVEVVLFCAERYEFPISPFPHWAHERAAIEMTKKLMPYRNVIIQIWNEKSVEVKKLYDAIKNVDFTRIVTNSPGYNGHHFLGNEDEHTLVDILTPHTNRHHEEFQLQAPLELGMLVEKYKKPVIDDEPARNGTLDFGGREGTTPELHIEQIKLVRELGCYHLYHHDMFQLSYGDPSIPPSGIPDPEHSEYHLRVFEWIRDNQHWSGK